MEDLGAEDPRWIGDYRLVRRLGAGGMGRVFLAHSSRGRTVAVKLVQTELAQQAEFRRRFKQEVRAAQRVGGAWTAPVLDADTEAATPWVATGYIAGPSLHAIVSESGRLPERTVRILAHGLTQALRDIHGAELVHRDLKPSNVLITIDGPRVIDFGIARALETVTDGILTRSGAVVGSPGFMSPEQVRGERVTPASDVFCLGSVLAYAATGRQPFGTADSGVHAVMYRIAQEEPDLEGLPEGLHELVTDCLKKAPDDRPSLDALLERTAGADDDGEPWLPGGLVAQLGRHAMQLLEVETPAGRGARAPAVPPVAGAAAQPYRRRPPRRRRPRRTPGSGGAPTPRHRPPRRAPRGRPRRARHYPRHRPLRPRRVRQARLRAEVTPPDRTPTQDRPPDPRRPAPHRSRAETRAPRTRPPHRKQGRARAPRARPVRRRPPHHRQPHRRPTHDRPPDRPRKRPRLTAPRPSQAPRKSARTRAPRAKPPQGPAGRPPGHGTVRLRMTHDRPPGGQQARARPPRARPVGRKLPGLRPPPRTERPAAGRRLARCAGRPQAGHPPRGRPAGSGNPYAVAPGTPGGRRPEGRCPDQDRARQGRPPHLRRARHGPTRWVNPPRRPTRPVAPRRARRTARGTPATPRHPADRRRAGHGAPATPPRRRPVRPPRLPTRPVRPGPTPPGRTATRHRPRRRTPPARTVSRGRRRTPSGRPTSPRSGRARRRFALRRVRRANRSERTRCAERTRYTDRTRYAGRTRRGARAQGAP
ncbi:serine/threonine protein kinase [Streptomyces malaysiensis]|uniref:serine/threonine protein kinase n=1 Tax=Streptomyces malaysiensis TaxID=92644 RepID=UPI00202DE094|nr:serine/threonine protein kinase [Streptomyces malaysiensis]